MVVLVIIIVGEGVLVVVPTAAVVQAVNAERDTEVSLVLANSFLEELGDSILFLRARLVVSTRKILLVGAACVTLVVGQRGECAPGKLTQNVPITVVTELG